MTNPMMYQSHVQELINSYPYPVTCYTDSSKLKNRTGSAYSIEGEIISLRHRNSASILTVKLQAFYQCLESILTLSPSHSATNLICSDSLSSLLAISNASSNHPLVQRIHIFLATLPNTNITFIWIPGRRSILGNENIDKSPAPSSTVPSDQS